MNSLVENQSDTAYTKQRDVFSTPSPSRRYAGETSQFMIEIAHTPGIARISAEDMALLLRQSVAIMGAIGPIQALARTMFVRREGVFDSVAKLADQPLPDDIEAAFASLVRALDTETVEDGEPHPAEDAIDGFVRKYGAGHFSQALFSDTFRPSRAASFLRLLGRIQRVPSTDRHRIVERGLASGSVEVRDAAIQAVESWHDASLASLLSSHHESESWLAEYAKAVAQDLTG